MIHRPCCVFLALLSLLLAAIAASANPLPKTGRYLQADPNATGLVLIDDQLAFNGRGIVPAVSTPSLGTQYGDGANLYEYLGSSPWMRSDPLGLSWDPFEEVDETALAHMWSGLYGVNKALLFAKEGTRLARAYERAAFQWDELVMDRDEGILFGLIGGPFFATICFESGTPILLPDGCHRPIDAVTLGDTVFSTPDPAVRVHAANTSPSDPDTYERIDHKTWKVVELQLTDPTLGVVQARLLRPDAWVDAMGIRCNEDFYFAFPGAGVGGTVIVTAIDDCPPLLTMATGGRRVTGTFAREKADILRLDTTSSDSSIGVTPSHPFYSLDRDEWVRARDLRVGERLRTVGGSTSVEAIGPVADGCPVFNIEVHGFHTYYVGGDMIWTHNPCFTSASGASSLKASVSGRTLRLNVDFMKSMTEFQTMLPGIRAYAANKGISTTIMSTGPVHNIKLLNTLRRMAARGRPFPGGGVVKLIDDWIDIGFFEIVWKGLP